MPEGPEIRRSADHLSRLLVGKYIVNALIGKGGRYTEDNPPPGFPPLLATMKKGAIPRVTEVNAKGKFMWWQLEHKDQTTFVWITYGMSGQWHRDSNKHTAFGIYFAPQNDVFDRLGNFIQPDTLYFNDPRHFGTIHFVQDPRTHEKKLASLGPDMLSNPPDERQFRVELLRKNQKTLAEVLMDQSVISGVGNYVKAEALYLAELSPHRIICELSTLEIERLRLQIINVMRASYNTGGATIRTYRNPYGAEGGAQRRFAVYGNQTDPMGNPVVREETKDGRTTHWVPAIQH